MNGVIPSLFSVNEEPPIVHYVAPDGESHTCSLDAAHLWLQAGYFTSQMRFIVAPKDAEIESGGWDVWTLDELIEQNGKAMPFLMYDGEQSRKEEETVRGLSEELADLKGRRQNVLGTMQSLQDRLVTVQAEKLLIEERIDSKPFQSPIEDSPSMPIESMPISESPPTQISPQCPQPIPLIDSAERILRIEQNRAFPLNEIDPFDVIHPVPAPVDQVDNTVNVDASELKQLYLNRDARRFSLLVKHLSKGEKWRCELCAIKLSSFCEVIQHAVVDRHVEMMRKNQLVYPLEPLAFWIHALRITQKNVPYWSFKTTRQCSMNHYLKSTPPLPRSVMETTLAFNISLEQNPFDEELKRASVGRIMIFEQNRVTPITGIDPFDVLCLFPAPLGQVYDMVTAYVIKLRSLFRKLCQSRFTILVDHLFVEKELRCAACGIRIGQNPIELIEHIMSDSHAKKMKKRSLVYPLEALTFWMIALRMADATDPWISPVHEKEELNLVDDMIAGMADPTSPIALLAHSTDLPHPCPDFARAVVILDSKLQKCDINKFNEAVHQYFDEALQCGVCVESDPIRSGSDFIAHVTSGKHVTNATRGGGRVSKKALRFWLEALCSTGAAILPREEAQVLRLFEER